MNIPVFIKAVSQSTLFIDGGDETYININYITSIHEDEGKHIVHVEKEICNYIVSDEVYKYLIKEFSK